MVSRLVALSITIYICSAYGCNFTDYEGNYRDVHGSRIRVATNSWEMLQTSFVCIRRDDPQLYIKGRQADHYLNTCLNVHKVGSDMLYVNPRTTNNERIGDERRIFLDNEICMEPVTPWDFRLYIKESTTPVSSCPEEISGFWQEVQASRVDARTKCHYYKTISLVEDPNRFSLRTMTYCADNAAEGTIDPVQPNAAVNTTVEPQTTVDCVVNSNGTSDGYHYTLIRSYNNSQEYDYFCMLYKISVVGGEVRMHLILHETDYRADTTCKAREEFTEDDVNVFRRTFTAEEIRNKNDTAPRASKGHRAMFVAWGTLEFFVCFVCDTFLIVIFLHTW